MRKAPVPRLHSGFECYRLDVCPGHLETVLTDAAQGEHSHRHRPLPQSTSASRFTAGASGFLNLSQSLERPER